MTSYEFRLSWGPLLASMPDAEDLALRRMIDLYFEREGPLPIDHGVLQEMVKLDWDCIEPVLQKFFERTVKGYVQADLQADVERMQRRRRVAVVNGSKGGRPRRV